MLGVLLRIWDEFNSLFCIEFVEDLGEITYAVVSD